jgi:adenine-specific DNA-methyltransferase
LNLSKKPGNKPVKTYRHPKAKLILRPEVGVQAQFKKKKPAKEYRYDSSLSPELNWDGQNPAPAVRSRTPLHESDSQDVEGTIWEHV